MTPAEMETRMTASTDKSPDAQRHLLDGSLQIVAAASKKVGRTDNVTIENDDQAAAAPRQLAFGLSVDDGEPRSQSQTRPDEMARS
jgi:hypothetical protein